MSSTDIVAILNPGRVQAVAVFVLILISTGAGLDFYLESRDRVPLGSRIRTWAERYPGFMAVLALVFGMMVGHFFFSLPSKP